MHYLTTRGCGWVPEFIHFCDTNHAPVDFISTHTYGVESGYLDEHGNAGTVLSRNPNSIFGEVKWVRQEIADSAMPKLELHFTEWSTSYTPADPSHDSYHSAAYILDKLKKCGDATQSMSYWTSKKSFVPMVKVWRADSLVPGGTPNPRKLKKAMVMAASRIGGSFMVEHIV